MTGDGEAESSAPGALGGSARCASSLGGARGRGTESASGAAMQGESRELGDARDMCRRAGRDGMQGEGLAPGMGADGDAVVDGGAEELLEAVGGLEVEGGGLVVTEQQSLVSRGRG